MQVDYIDHMGDDLMIVDAARVSFDKKSEYESYSDPTEIQIAENHTEIRQGKFLKESDKKLIHYLAKHNHWTPFAHPQIQLRMTVPIFIANQLKRHQIGFALNEVSRRYVDDEPKFYHPEVWRKRPDKSIKQGSTNEKVEWMYDDPMYGDYRIRIGPSPDQEIKNINQSLITLYNEMIKQDVAPEMARMILPQSMYTSWIWTGSLAAWARLCKQRLDPHAQKESQEIAKMISNIIGPLFPVAWPVLLTVANE